MDKVNSPTQLDALTESIRGLGIHLDIFLKILSVLEEHQKQVYACREDMKLLRASAASADRISREALLKLSDLQREIRSSK